MEIALKPIGVIRTPFKNKPDTPIQGTYAPDALGTVTLFKKYMTGLKDIDTFTHIYLIYYFDRAGEIKMVRQTFLDDTPHGLFATRHPCRPNGIGLTIVKLVKCEGANLIVSGVDMLDRTPLLDIKPYIPRFDNQRHASNGWVGLIKKRKKPDGRE